MSSIEGQKGVSNHSVGRIVVFDSKHGDYRTSGNINGCSSALKQGRRSQGGEL